MSDALIPVRKSVRLRHARRARVLRVTRKLLVQGECLAVIAAAEGITRQRLAHMLGEVGVVRAGRPHRRTVIAHVREADLEALDALCAESGRDRSGVISVLVQAALDGGGKPGRRLAGKMLKARP